MDRTYYVDRVKFQLTGGILDSELPDEGYNKIIEIALQELNRYYNATELITVPGEKCIDLQKVETDNNIHINSVSTIYRSKPKGVGGDGRTVDPMYLSQWNFGNSYYGSFKWASNLMAYNTANQISNTLSTDLDFKEDKIGRKLYINFSNGVDDSITIEYIPRLTSPEEVVGDYWVDIFCKLSLAYAKIMLGRIRTRYTQTDALWEQDGTTLLEEGTTELKELEERLRDHACFSYPLD